MLVGNSKKWDFALGMIQVDGLKPSAEMLELIEKEKRGKITMDELRERLYVKYRMKRVK
jgi:hypothetical protein